MLVLNTASVQILVTLVILLSTRNVELRERNYEGYTVIRSVPQSNAHLRYLRSLSNSVGADERELQFWTQPLALNHTVDTLVSPRRQASFLKELTRLDIPSRTIIEDVVKAIEETKSSNLSLYKQHEYALNQPSDSFYNQFQRYAVIEAKIKELEQLDPRVSVSIIGQSYEKRNIYLVKVSNDFSSNKSVVLIDAGHHAREWISHATGLYLLESLVNIDVPRMSPELCRHDTCRELTLKRRVKLDLNNYDFWFIPVVNPDGYEYSHKTDRMWRKTRSGSSYRICRGTDPNRNYPFHWMESGSSSFTCSEIYAGPTPRSEPEVDAVATVLEQNCQRVKLYISLHCYSQMVLAPYGYASVYPKNYDELSRVAEAYTNSMKKLRNTNYLFGTSAMALYPSSGGADDFAHSLGIPFTYTIELPDKGNNGFLTPPSEIIPIAHETLIGLQSMVDSIEQCR